MNAATRLGCSLLLLGAIGCERDANTRDLVIFAPSSATEAFQELAATFSRIHPDVRVRLAFAGSQTLRLQLEHGARADVFASANEGHVRALERGGFIRGVEPLAANRLAVVVPLENPAGIDTFSDLLEAKRLVIGTPTVPIGIYTARLFENATGVLGPNAPDALRERVVSEETNARLVRAKVELGEADAAIVYATDALASKRVLHVPIPAPLNVSARYFVARVARDPAHPDVDAWMTFLQSEQARAILRGHGFRTH